LNDSELEVQRSLIIIEL